MPTGIGDVPVVDAAATFDEAAATGCASIVHRDLDHPAVVTLRVADRRVTSAEATVLTGGPKDHNDWDDPHAVEPAPLAVTVGEDGTVQLTAPAPSHVVVRFRTQP